MNGDQPQQSDAPQSPPQLQQQPEPPQSSQPPQQTLEQNGSWYKPEAGGSDAPVDPSLIQDMHDLLDLPENPGGTPSATKADVQWTASEFIAHQKGLMWYALLILVGAVIAAVGWFVTKDVLSVVVIVLVVVLFAASGGRKPRVLDYSLNRMGIEIGGKQYHYAEFRSFAVMKEGAFSSIMLVPLKRFMPPLSVYYDPKDEQTIVDAISHYLPLEQRQHDMFDQLAARIRF